MKELRNTINALGKQKATGYDNICNEFLKLSTERILKIILAFFKFNTNKRLNYIKLVFRYNITNT